MTLRRLDWDSDFFGREVGRLDLNNVSLDVETIPESFSFVYIFSDRPLTDAELQCSRGSIHLADEKRIYHKQQLNISTVREGIQSFHPDRKIPERLYELAIQSGHHSRFSTDPHLPPSYFQQLYRTWLERSVSRAIADEVLVYETEGQIRGFVTLGIKNGRPDIGLIAVHTNDRSSGIGAALLQAAEQWAVQSAHRSEIQVVTQGSNQGACRFYEKNEYMVDTVNYVYHWWNKN